MIENIKEILITFIISALPVIELRGAVPYALANDIAWPVAFIVSVIGNMLPVPFIVLFMRKLFKWLYRFKFMRKPLDWMDKRLRHKSEKVLKTSAVGLAIFVAIPLPGTGAWTASMIASILDMRMKIALPAIFAGVVGAGIIVTVVTQSAIEAFIRIFGL